jgi:hypothetical protein
VLILSMLAAMVLGLLLLLAVTMVGGGYSPGVSAGTRRPVLERVAGLALDAAVVAAFSPCASLRCPPFRSCRSPWGRLLPSPARPWGATIAYLSRGADGDEELLASYDP